MSATGAGWYDDPGGIHRSRYWDGEKWTNHVVKDLAYVPPFEEWPRMRWWGRGQVRWWWASPLIVVTMVAMMGFTSGAYAPLAVIPVSPIVFLISYLQYRGWRRRADAKGQGDLGLPR